MKAISFHQHLPIEHPESLIDVIVDVPTPRRDGKDWPTLSRRVNAALETSGHVAYIEPDAEVNHLDEAKALAGEQSCVATLRNLAPEDAAFEIVTWPSRIPVSYPPLIRSAPRRSSRHLGTSN